jgi:glycosyltransferase involved in cell wall biosynthesis
VRVLAVTPAYPPHSRVGAWLATHAYMRHLVRLGHTVTAVAMSSTSRGWEHDGVKVVTGRRGLTYPVELARGCDVVVSHFGDGGVGAKIARKAGRPSVQMVHGHIHRGPSSADLLVFNSHNLQESTPHGSASIVCHPPVFADEWCPSDPQADGYTLVNLSKPKGVKVAWACAERLPGRRFIGVRGGYGQQLEPRATNFETLPTQQDMRDVYRQTRVLLMPSEVETWGMVGVEAMASGVPVIAHPTAGLVESLGDAGIFVDRCDIDGWVDAIEALDDPAAYRAASQAASARAKELDPSDDLERFVLALEGLS